MLGAVIVVIVMLVVGPAVLFAAGAAWSAMLGGALEASRRDGGGDAPAGR